MIQHKKQQKIKKSVARFKVINTDNFMANQALQKMAQ